MAVAGGKQGSSQRFLRLDPGPIFDTESVNEDVEMQTVESPRTWIVAVDFGTTFSSVAYASLAEGSVRGGLDLINIQCVAKYPHDEPVPQVTWAWNSRLDVPTEIWYPPKLPRRQARRGEIDAGLSADRSSTEDSADSDSSSRLSLSSSGGDDDSVDEDAGENGNATPQLLYWGFGVQRQLKRTHIPKDNTRRVARFKLMLDEKSGETEQIRGELLATFKVLKRMKLIKKNTDVIADYLEKLFTHTKNQLQRTEGFDGSGPIEFVLCVPAIWTTKACRIMQTAMAKAVVGSGLRSREHGNLNDLFIISEPEAAAACVLAENSNDIYPNETIILIDAGGGTVDAVTYKVTSSYPPRLAAEATKPGSKLCGASYINERFEALLLKKLKHEQYLVRNGRTIQSIVDAKVMDFENGYKRIIDVTDRRFQYPRIDIDDLQARPRKGLYTNQLELKPKEFQWVYRLSLDGAAQVLTEQLEMAKAKGLSVQARPSSPTALTALLTSKQKVLLTGGFGNSPSLKNHLRKVLADFQDREIAFLIPQSPSTTVARGAVLRALNKELGPSRVTQCSYGFLRTEPVAPDLCVAHRNIRASIDKADGEKYVEGTIDWLIRKVVLFHLGEILPHRKEISIRMKHTFNLQRQNFICRETLYVSDLWHESHYRKTHVMNKGAEVAGLITVDMTFLKREGHIQPKPPSDFSQHGDPKKLHWDVEFDLVMIVDGRNLYYEARWPPSNPEEIPVQQVVMGRGQTCIAAAFEPGTA